MAEGTKDVGARLAAKGRQGPDFKYAFVETSWGVSLRSPHLQVLSLGALKKWNIWRLDIMNAFQRADGFRREVFLCAPAGWVPRGDHRIWKLQSPTYGLNDEPVAFRDH